MGYTRLIYKVKEKDLNIETLINEIEYGNTFNLSLNCEKIITAGNGKNRWIKWGFNNNILELRVDDEFLQYSFFEKIFTTFIFNLLDFGDIYLSSLDFSKSFVVDRDSRRNNIKNFYSNVALGTIIKPYFHLSMSEKRMYCENFLNKGLVFIKEDETYLISKEKLLSEVKELQPLFKGRGYYVPNISHFISDYAVIDQLIEMDIKVAMVNILVVGFQQIKLIKQRFPMLTLWGHRVGYKAFSNLFSMNVLGKLALYSGIDLMHVGTPNTKNMSLEKRNLINELRNFSTSFVPIFTKTSPEVINKFIRKITPKIVLACGYFRKQNGDIDWNKVDYWIESAIY